MKFKRRRRHNKQLLLTQAFLVLLLFIGIGYSILNTNLGINGTVQLAKVNCKVNNKLYNVLRCEYEKEGIVKKYTSNHADTIDSSGNEIVGEKDIYYYSAASYNNVRLGNMCWKILRTTDTGGVKIIYNGEYTEENKCNVTLDQTQIYEEEIKFNTRDTDAKYCGYKYKTTVDNDTNSNIKNKVDEWYMDNANDFSSIFEDIVFCNDRTGSKSSSSSSSTTWMGEGTTDFYYHNNSSYKNLTCTNVKDRFSVKNADAKLTYPIALPTAPELRLLNNALRKNSSSYWTISPKFYNSCHMVAISTSGALDYDRASNSDGFRPVVSLIPDIEYTGGTGTLSDPYVIPLPPAGTTPKSLYNRIEELEFVGKIAKYTGEHADTVDSSGNEIVGDKNIYYYKSEGSNNVKFGNYCWQIIRTTDTGGIKLIYNGEYDEQNKCNNSGTQQQLPQTKMFNQGQGNLKYSSYKYKTVEDNDTDSTIKEYIDSWYEENLSEKTSQLEDTVFCSDRTGSTSGNTAATGTTWMNEGTTKFYYHNFYDNSQGYSNLACMNSKDRFSVTNTLAKLKYPIALMSAPEANVIKKEELLETGEKYWLLSPTYYDSWGEESYISSMIENGIPINYSLSFESLGVRPSISLKPGIKYVRGTGIPSNPYIIED